MFTLLWLYDSVKQKIHNCLWYFDSHLECWDVPKFCKDRMLVFHFTCLVQILGRYILRVFINEACQIASSEVLYFGFVFIWEKNTQ